MVFRISACSRPDVSSGISTKWKRRNTRTGFATLIWTACVMADRLLPCRCPSLRACRELNNFVNRPVNLPISAETIRSIWWDVSARVPGPPPPDGVAERTWLDYCNDRRLLDSKLPVASAFRDINTKHTLGCCRELFNVHRHRFPFLTTGIL